MPVAVKEPENLEADAVANAIHVFCQEFGLDTLQKIFAEKGYCDNCREFIEKMIPLVMDDLIVLATKFGIHFDMSSSEPNKPLVPDARKEHFIRILPFRSEPCSLVFLTPHPIRYSISCLR